MNRSDSGVSNEQLIASNEATIQMFEHMLMPLHRRFDGGFGATGNAFKEGADQLVAANMEGTFHFVNGHLPIKARGPAGEGETG